MNVAPDSSRPETNCDDADASISTRAARHGAGAADAERQRVTVECDAEPAQRVEQGSDGPGAGLFVAVERDVFGAERGDRRDEPQDRAGQTAVDRRHRATGRRRR